MIRDLDSSLSPLPCYLFFIASSLSPHLVRFLARLSALCRASCRLPSFPFQRFGRPDCGSSYWWYGVDGRRSRCRLIKMVLVERANELSKVPDS